MNRTHWVKTAAGLGAACFITIGMSFSGTDASAMTNTGVLDNYFMLNTDNGGAGTPQDSVIAQNDVITAFAATSSAVSTQSAVSTAPAVSTVSAISTESAVSTAPAVDVKEKDKKNTAKEKAKKRKKALDKKWGSTAVAISKDDIINVRKSPSSSGKKIAKMENGDAVKIIGKSKSGNWVKVKSGKVKGYVWKKSLVKGGTKVEKLADKYATTYAELKKNVDVLNLRSKKSLSASIVSQLKGDDVCKVTKAGDKWLKVKVNSLEGYVAKKYTKTYRKFTTATVLENKNNQQEKVDETISFSKSDKKLGNQIVNYASQFIGNPYVWGGTSLTNGADCSGFVLSVYKKFGYSLPHSSASQANCGKKVAIKDLQPGDLVFYRHGDRIGHVVIYAGNGKAVEAMGSKWGIVSSNLNYSRAYCARRIIK